MKKLFLISLILILSLVFGIKNLGTFLDVTQKPIQSDIIVSLGGDNGNRIKKALELYEQNLSQSNKIILTGPNGKKDPRIIYLTNHAFDMKNIVLYTNTLNTYAEIKTIKNYMLAHRLKRVLIVSDPPHARRIAFFANTVFDFHASGLEFTIIGSEQPWWNTQHYYDNTISRDFARDELIKYIYYALRHLCHSCF